ncbi:MAG: cytochrome c3 family protein [Anaerolineales bacterium]
MIGLQPTNKGFDPSKAILLLGALLLTVLFVSPLIWSSAEASEGQQPPAQDGPDNETCFACHASPDLQTELSSGEILDLTVFPGAFDNSVHGMADLQCIQCHTEIEGYPHPPIQADTRREYTINQYRVCADCHQEKYDETLDSVHSRALAGGNFNAAVCTDCHGAHDVRPPGEPRSQIAQTCRQCHTTIYDQYRDSVHGEALIGQGNPDVPVCTDCHGVHSIEGPSADHEFRLFSPQLCAECHADEELMAKYDISTNVFDTYVADFHGTTVTLFQQIAPGQETNKALCIDCHGVHDIIGVDDPDSPIIKENLLNTCQKCHPDATTNFPSAWLGHYEPSPQNAPIVYYVDLFYKIFIPAVLGGMAIFVIGDAGHRILQRRSKSEEEKSDE